MRDARPSARRACAQAARPLPHRPNPSRSPSLPPPPVVAAAARSPSAELEPLPPPAEDLWDRIRRGFAMPDLDDPLVAKWEQWYVARPDYVARMIDRSRRYLYYIVVEVEKRGMPLEIALLPMVESAFNPNAVSVARASGIWQFMPATGTHYGLKQNFWFDSRRDVVAATEGALTYLQKLHGDFDDWQLALAGYNWGEGNVARAVAREPEAGPPGRLRESQDAGRDAQLPAEAAGAEEHRSRPREIFESTWPTSRTRRISPWSRWTARST